MNIAKPKHSIKTALFVATQCVLILAVAILQPVGAAPNANDRIGFAVSPPTFELSANPGDKISQSVRVDNLTNDTLALQVIGKDFVPAGEEGQAAPTDKMTNYSLASWITLSDASLEVPARGSKTVRFTINVPLRAEPGGHFGSIVFRTNPGQKPNGGGVAVGQEVGSLLLLKVAGQVTEKASLAGFKSTQDIWQDGPITFDTRVKNEGNVQLKPTGTITINNLFGEKIASIPIDSHTILPESTRRLAASWQGTSMPGWYTATASVSYGSNDQILTSTARFAIFPFRVILPVVVVLALLGFVIYRARHRLSRAIRILAGKE